MQRINASPRSVDQLLEKFDLESARSVLQQVRSLHDTMPQWAEERWLLVNPAWHATISDGKVRLRAPVEDHATFLLSCYRDQSFMRQFNRLVKAPQSEAQLRMSLRHTVQSVVRNRSAYWIVEVTQGADNAVGQNSWRAAGIIGLTNIVIAHRRAEFMTGFPNRLQQASIPVRSCLLLLAHVFNELELKKINAIVFADNPHSQRSTLSLGFTQEGYRKAQVRDPVTAEYLDTFENGLLREDFFANARLQRLRCRFQHTANRIDSHD